MKRQVKSSTGRSTGYSVSESTGEQAAVSIPSGTDLIDLNTGAVAAYSMSRRLRTNYAGSLFRVRRSSDNAEQDIGISTTGLVDLGALTAFVGADSGFLVTWYDQSTTGINLTNATAGTQPIVISAGASVVLGTNSRLAAQYDAVTAHRVAAGTSLDMTGTDDVAVFIAGRKTSDAGFSVLLTRGNATAGQPGAFRVEAPPAATTTLGFRVIGGSAPSTVTLGSITAGTAFVACGAAYVRAAGTQSWRQLRRGSPSATISSSVQLQTTSLGLHAVRVGCATDGSSGFTGECGEVIIFDNSARASASSSIDNNLKTFWGIT